jgi:hypothetical protein
MLVLRACSTDLTPQPEPYSHLPTVEQQEVHQDVLAAGLPHVLPWTE